MNTVDAVLIRVKKPDNNITLIDYTNRVAKSMRDKAKEHIKKIDESVGSKRPKVAPVKEVKPVEPVKPVKEIKSVLVESRKSEEKDESDRLSNRDSAIKSFSKFLFKHLDEVKITNLKEFTKKEDGKTIIYSSFDISNVKKQFPDIWKQWTEIIGNELLVSEPNNFRPIEYSFKIMKNGTIKVTASVGNKLVLDVVKNHGDYMQDKEDYDNVLII
jgi:hypothetical protein